MSFLPEKMNRHGLIAGATGTGKTVTCQTLAETFSDLGSSVLLVDAKGDLTGMGQPGGNKSSVTKRVDQTSMVCGARAMRRRAIRSASGILSVSKGPPCV